MEDLEELGEVFDSLLNFAVLGSVLRQSQPAPPPPPPPPQVVVVERRLGERRRRQEPYREERRSPGSERRAVPPPAPARTVRPGLAPGFSTAFLPSFLLPPLPPIFR